MADAAARHAAPGVGIPAGDAGTVRLEALARQTLVNLRATPERADVLDSVAGILGQPLPNGVNRWRGDADRFALRLGPDEWLLAAPADRRTALEADLAAVLAADERGSVCDVSHSYSGFVLGGPRARDVLAKGCALDLHPAAFTPGDSAQTLLAAANVLLRCVDESRIELRVRNSFARYASAWLLDAMAEFVTR